MFNDRLADCRRKRDGIDLTGSENVRTGSGGGVLRVRINLDLGEVQVTP